LLQTHNQWASFTARGRAQHETTEQIARVILDGGNPLYSQAVMRVELADGRRVEATRMPREYKVNGK
jgi:hypothetical protein